MSEIRISRSGEEFGPFSPAEVVAHVAEGRIVATDLAWRDGMAGWEPLAHLPEFSHLFGAGGGEGSLAVGGAPAGSATERYLRRHAAERQPRRMPSPGSRRRKLVGLLAAGALVLLVSAYLLATYLIGSGAHRGVTGLAGQFAAASGPANQPAFNAEVVDYRRGFFKSSGTLVLSPTQLPTVDAARPRFGFEIHHGPLVAGPGGFKVGSQGFSATIDRSKWSAEARDVAGEIFGDQEPVVVTGLAGFSGAVTALVRLAAFAPDNPAKFEGGEFRVRAEPDDGTLDADGELGEFIFPFESLGGRLRIGKSSYAMHYSDLNKEGPGASPDGEFRFELPEARIELEDGSGAEVTGLEFTQETETDDAGILSHGTSLRTNAIRTFGEGAPLAVEGRLTMDFSLRGLHQEKVAQAMRLLEAAEGEASGAGPEPGEAETEGEPPAAGAVKALAGVLTPGLGFTFNTGLSGGDEAAGLDFDFEYRGERPFPEAETLGAALSGIEAMLGIRFSKGLVAGSDLEEMVAALVEEGNLSDGGDHYSARLRVSDGEIRLNGEVLPLPEKIDAMLDGPVDFEALAQGDFGSGLGPGEDPNAEPDPGFDPDPDSDADTEPDPGLDPTSEDPVDGVR
jgi:hypothetical protein